LVLLPEEGDGVWIEFEAGDRHRPIWTGFWWANGELPQPGGPTTRVLATTKGHQLVLDDEGDAVKLIHAGGARIVLTGGSVTVTFGEGDESTGMKGIVLTDSTLKVFGTALTVSK
jgi:hypothetical protein